MILASPLSLRHMTQIFELLPSQVLFLKFFKKNVYQLTLSNIMTH